MINMNVMERIENSITNGWYPEIKEVKPRVYHEHLRDMEKENIYGCKCIGEEECTHKEKEEDVSDVKEPEVDTISDDDEDPQQPTE